MTESNTPDGAGSCPATPSGGGNPPRVAASLAAIAGYYWLREPLGEWIGRAITAATGQPPEQSTPRIAAMTLLLAVLFVIWRKVLAREKKLHAPAFITVILGLSDASFGILENHPAPAWLAELTRGVILEYNPTFITIGVTLLTEMILGRFFWGKWPNLTSAYITGISAGILIKTSILWPFLLAGMISITSKYALRLYGRHLWNPTNFGITALLFLTPEQVASLSVQAGNNGMAVAVIWLLGGFIMYKLGRFHIPIAFFIAFVPLSLIRSSISGHPWQTELAPMTSPMFALYIFFMITDPPTTTRARWSQVLVAVLVAIMESVCRIAFKDVHSLYHALFTVGPAANVVEILAGRYRARASQPAEKREPAIASP